MQVATLRSAVKLEQEQQFLIAKKLQELTGSKNIKLKPVIDEELIAGFVVEYGSSQVRGSQATPYSVLHSANLAISSADCGHCICLRNFVISRYTRHCGLIGMAWLVDAQDEV